MKEFTVNGASLKCYPLTAAQRMHNYTIKYCPCHQVLNIGTGLYVQQDVDFKLLKEAIYQAYERFDSMRLRFIKDEDGTVYQYVMPFEEREIGFCDFSKWNEETAHNEMRKWTAEPFERYNSPMNKVVMVKLPGGYNGIYLKVDHMTMDSSSIIAFDRDVLELYCAKKYGTEMPKPTQSYIKAVERDLTYEADSDARKRDEEFWMNELSRDEPMYTDFTGMGRLLTQRRENGNPNQRSAVITSKSLEAAISVYHLEAEPSERLMKFCLDNNVPMASLLLMGLRTVLSQFNNNEKDVSVKTNVARRGTLLEKRSGGTRIHFFPLRTILEPEMTFLDGIRVIQTEQNRIFRHANFDPIELTMRRSKHWKLAPGASYESISLTYQPLTLRQRDTTLPDIDYKSYWYSNGVAAQPLYLTVMHRVEDNGLNFNFEYKKDVVTAQEMECLYYYLCRVLFRGIEDKDRTIGEILEMI
ncbi:condensation domain-containing protein [Porcipelethomonas sp.]|uniref:condensation domain-containing protein n=1 Tax=Porcipelethomonas sp. TaxID=2981675 RepID=UPI003EFA0CD3